MQWTVMGALGIVPIVACGSGNGIFDVNDPRFEATADFADTIAIDNRTKVDLAGINGAVTIGGDASATNIVIRGIRRVRSDSKSDAEAHLDDVEVVIVPGPTSLVIETVHHSDPSGRSYEVEYDISVPKWFDVEIVNVNGAIVVTQLDGDVDLRNTNGAILLTDVTGDLDVDVTNGAITAVATMASGGSIDLRTTNGELNLSVPTTTSANFEATIVNGLITITNLMLNNESITDQQVTGSLGSGDGSIVLGVTNGGIVVTGS